MRDCFKSVIAKQFNILKNIVYFTQANGLMKIEPFVYAKFQVNNDVVSI